MNLIKDKEARKLIGDLAGKLGYRVSEDYKVDGKGKVTKPLELTGDVKEEDNAWYSMWSNFYVFGGGRGEPTVPAKVDAMLDFFGLRAEIEGKEVKIVRTEIEKPKTKKKRKVKK